MANAGGFPPWIIEGQAEWVGETLTGGTRSSRDSWLGWLGNAGFPLFQHSYDAIGGRRIELRADGSYHVTDDGTDPVHVRTDTSAGPAESTANVIVDGSGHYTARGSGTVEFALDAITSQIRISVVDAGQSINSEQPLDPGLGGVYGLTGTAHYTCAGNQLTLAFPNVTFVLEREVA